MKIARILLLSSFALIPFAAHLPKSLAARAPDGSIQQQIVAKEREELDTLKSGDHQAFANLLADDAIFLDPRGHGTKAEVVEHTSDFRLLDYTMENIKFVPVGSNSGVIAYKLTQKGNAHGHEFTSVAFASALWTKRDGKWLCLFSQETPARLN
jgi:ketosteroid isomerase-like protein